MSFESEYFKRSAADKEKLAEYGFVKRNGEFFYSALFHENTFSAEVRVNEKGEVSGKIIDLETGDEYFAFRSQSRTGEFVGMIREEYGEILKGIKDNCFVPVPFLLDQSNRIARCIYETYGEQPDYPFKKLSDYGVFRHESNSKWYGLIMNIPKSKITKLKKDEKITAEIINIKVDPQKLEKLLDEEGIYPCYHMNKGNWVSVVLDETLPDKKVMELIDESRNLTAGRKNTMGSKEVGKWIVPANPKYYDIESEFKDGGNYLWKQGKGIKKGDIVYIYVGAPISAIRYRCKVTETDIPYQYTDDKLKILYAMRIDVIKSFEKNLCDREKMKSFGVKTVRGPRYMPAEMEDYLIQQSEK